MMYWVTIKWIDIEQVGVYSGNETEGMCNKIISKAIKKADEEDEDMDYVHEVVE